MIDRIRDGGFSLCLLPTAYCLLPTAYCPLPTASLHPICVVFALYPRPSARSVSRRLAYCRMGRYRIRLTNDKSMAVLLLEYASMPRVRVKDLM